MRRSVLLLILLAGCSKGPQADLQFVSEARSLAAEWALVNEQAKRGQLTPVYIASMREDLRREIESAQSRLSEPNSAYGREIAALLRERDDAAAETLRAHSDNLEMAENSLESA